MGLRRWLSLPLFCLLVQSLLLAPAGATDRFFRDLSATSSNGAYRATATSPDNAHPTRRRPFARRFTFTLFDRGDQAIWRFMAEGGEPPPVRLFVHDGGAVVIWDSLDQCHVVSPEGERRHVLRLREILSREEQERFIVDTTAGDQWAGLALWYFAQTEGGTYFCVRTWWDRRIVVDVGEVRAVGQISASLDEALTATEQRIVVQKLQATKVEHLQDGDHLFGIATATYLAGKLGVTEAVESLRRIEASARLAWCAMGEYEWEEYRLRQIAQLSLRRLGQRPVGYAASTVPVPAPARWSIERPVRPEPLDPRCGQRVLIGALMADVAQTLGPPDCVTAAGRAWDYDVDQDEPFTLRVTFRNGAVASVEHLAPPAWQRPHERDRQLAQ